MRKVVLNLCWTSPLFLWVCPKPLLRRCPLTGPEQGLAPNLGCDMSGNNHVIQHVCHFDTGTWPEQEFNILKSSLFYCRETQYDCFSFVISYWKQLDLSMSASMSRNLKIAWFFPCIFLFYLPVDSTTHVDLSLILNSMLDSIKTKKYFCEQENGRQRAFVPVLDPSRPVWVCSNWWPSRFRLTFTRLARIHDGRTRNTDGAQP